jgi:phosphoheptose isomerase
MALADTLEGSLAAIALVSHTALMTAYANDRSWDAAFAQQVLGLGRAGDALIAISTSGNAADCVNAARVAKAKGLKTIALTGEGGGKLAQVCDVAICVPARETYLVQELHLPVYHALCAAVEDELFG